MSMKKGTLVNIEAIPASGWEFTTWMGEVADNESSLTTVQMDKDKTVAAVFSETGEEIEFPGGEWNGV